jgi:hypothetical protein
VEHYDKFHSRFCFTGGYDLWRASQAECDTSMEHVVFPSPILDSCCSYDGVTVRGMFFLFAMLRDVNSLCFVAQAMGFKNINGESIQSVLEMLLIRFFIPCTDAWNMVSYTRFFRLLLLTAFSIDVPIPTSYVLVTAPLTQLTCSLACLSYTVALMYALSAYLHLRVHSFLYRVITSSRAYRDLFQYITG